MSLILVVYSPSPANEWVWDDHFFVEQNAVVQGKAPVSNLWTQPVRFERSVLPLWRPLPLSAHALLRAAAGSVPAIFHVASVLLHASVVVLLFLWLREMRVPGPPAFAAAALYGVHPYLTSAVAYVSGVADPLAALFSLLALIAWHRAYLRFGERPGTNAWQKWVLSGCLFWLAALFCKEWTLILPGLAVIAFAGTGRRRAGHGRLFWTVGCWTCLFFAGIYFCFRSEVFAGAETETVTTLRMDFPERIACAVMSLGFYQLGGILPFNLRMDRYYHLARPEFWLWFAAGAALFIAWYAAFKRFGGAWVRSGAWRGLCWFLALWLFHSNLIFVLNAHVAEHWMYFAYMGLAWAAADLWSHFGASLSPGARRVLPAMVLILGLFWSARSFIRQLDWQDDLTFFSRNIEAGADTTRSHLALGSAYAREGDFQKASDHFSRVLEKDPMHFQATMALARCYYFAGDAAKAAAIVRQLRARHPTDPVLQWFEADCVRAMEAKKTKAH